MKRFEVFISGAGVAGLTLACLLAKSGISVGIIDSKLPKKTKKPEHGTRTAAIMSSLLPLYEEIGIFEEIKTYSEPLKSLHIIDTAGAHFSKPVEQRFNASEIEQDEFSWNIPNNLLLHSLYKKATTYKNLKIFAEDHLEHFETTETAINITTASKQAFTTSLLIGADGKYSTVREKAGIKAKQTDLNQTAITAIITHAKPHGGTSTEFHKSGGPFTLVPLQGNQSSLVWVETTAKAEQIVTLTEKEITKEIQTLSNNILGTITPHNEIQSFPLTLLKANDIVAPRIALIAEAAHTLPPTGAQGLNLSLRDIKALTETLKNAKQLGSDLGSKATLDTYKKQRAADIELRTNSTGILNYFVREDSHLHHTVRRGLFSTLSHVPSLRNKIMKKGFQ